MTLITLCPDEWGEMSRSSFLLGLEPHLALADCHTRGLEYEAILIIDMMHPNKKLIVRRVAKL